MFKSNAFKDSLRVENVLLWLVLAFQAGFVNAGGFLACHRFVSHVTGFGTQIGLSIATKEYLYAFEMMLAPVSFIIGAAFSAFLIDRQTYQQKEGYVKTSVIIQSLLLVTVFILGEVGVFGIFGEPLQLQRDFALLFLLCFICGMQNATFATLTNGMIRTTHLTGLATDFGMNMVRIPVLQVADQERLYQKKVNFLRLNTILAFSLGSLIAAILFPHVQYHGFIVPALTSMIILFLSYRVMGTYDQTKSTLSNSGQVKI
jgi:uncharacterized membrane protein YoaK (UPF0700 family)